VLTQGRAIWWAVGRDHAAPPSGAIQQGSPWMAHESDLLRATPAQARGPAGTMLKMAHAIVNGLACQAAAKSRVPVDRPPAGAATAGRSQVTGP
jgi:hypothetical protein